MVPSQTPGRRAGLVSVASLASLALALSLAAAVTSQRPLPQWGYRPDKQFPSGWFGANSSGFENAAQLETIAKYDMAIFGWQARLAHTVPWSSIRLTLLSSNFYVNCSRCLDVLPLP